MSKMTNQAEIRFYKIRRLLRKLKIADYYNNEDCTIIKPVITKVKTIKVYNKNTTAIPKAA